MSCIIKDSCYTIMNEEDFLNEMKEQEEDMDFFYDDVPESPIELDYITHE